MALFICFTPSDLEELSELFQSCPDEALIECLEEAGYQPDSEVLEEKAKAQAEADLHEEEQDRLRGFREAEAELRKAEQASLEARRALRALRKQLSPSVRGRSVEELEFQLQRLEALVAEKAQQIDVAKAVETAKADVDEAELAERKLRERFNRIYG